MNGRTVVLKGLLISMSWIVTAEYPPPPEGGGEVNDACYVDSGPMDCSPLNNITCPQQVPCVGHQITYSGETGNELKNPLFEGGYLGDYVYEVDCYEFYPCIASENPTGNTVCVPDDTASINFTKVSGSVNWDMPCPPLLEW